VGGSKKKFSIDVNNAITGHWSIDASEKLQENLILTDGGNTIWIKVKDDITLTGEKIILRFFDVDNTTNFSEVEIEVVS